MNLRGVEVLKMVDIDRAILDPAGVFKVPSEVLQSSELTKEQMIMILRQWEYDARELEVAEEESMIGNNTHLLDQVQKALMELGGNRDPHHSSPNKQGG